MSEDLNTFVDNVDAADLQLLEEASRRTGVKFRTSGEKTLGTPGEPSDRIFEGVLCRDRAAGETLLREFRSLKRSLSSEST